MGLREVRWLGFSSVSVATAMYATPKHNDLRNNHLFVPNCFGQQFGLCLAGMVHLCSMWCWLSSLTYLEGLAQQEFSVWPLIFKEANPEVFTWWQKCSQWEATKGKPQWSCTLQACLCHTASVPNLGWIWERSQKGFAYKRQDSLRVISDRLSYTERKGVSHV